MLERSFQGYITRPTLSFEILKLQPPVPPVQKILNQKKFVPIDWIISVQFFKIRVQLWDRQGMGLEGLTFSAPYVSIYPLIIIIGQNIFYKNSCLEETFSVICYMTHMATLNFKLCHLVIPKAQPHPKFFFLTKRGPRLCDWTCSLSFSQIQECFWDRHRGGLRDF